MAQRLVMTRGVAYPWFCDGMGHVATRFYTGWFDDASYHLMAHVGGDMATLGELQLGWADVQSLVNYHQEMRADDLFLVESGFTRLGNKSVTALHEIKRTDGTLLASQEVTTVQFDLRQRKAAPVHAPIREQIQACLDA